MKENKKDKEKRKWAEKQQNKMNSESKHGTPRLRLDHEFVSSPF